MPCGSLVVSCHRGQVRAPAEAHARRQAGGGACANSEEGPSGRPTPCPMLRWAWADLRCGTEGPWAPVRRLCLAFTLSPSLTCPPNLLHLPLTRSCPCLLPSKPREGRAYSRCSVTAGPLTCPRQRSRAAEALGVSHSRSRWLRCPNSSRRGERSPAGRAHGERCGGPGASTVLLPELGDHWPHCLFGELPRPLSFVETLGWSPADPDPSVADPRPAPLRQTVTDARRRRDAPLGRRHSGPGAGTLRQTATRPRSRGFCPAGQSGAGGAVPRKLHLQK